MKSCCVLICSLAVILFGCTYEPDGHYINPNIYLPPPHIPASIDIAVRDIDDIVGEFPLVIPTYFRVKVDRADKFLRHFKVTKEGQAIELIYSSGPQDYLLLLDPANLTDGTHEYDIEMELSSGSRSLAEAVGLENYFIQKKLVVTVDKSLPSPVSGLTAAMENGHMVLTWDKPAHKNYFYSITKYNETSKYGDAAVIWDPDVTEWIDEGFLGGHVRYEVALSSAFFHVVSEPATYELNFIEANSQLDMNYLKLKWTMHQNFGEDVFVRISGRHFTKDFPATHTGEAIVDSLYLGDVATSTLKLLRKGLEADGLTLSYTTAIGDKIRPFEQYSLIESGNKLLLHGGPNSYKTYRYNATTLMVEDSSNFLGVGDLPLLSSQDGFKQYLVSGHTLYSFDPMDLSVYPTQIHLNSIYRPLWNRDLAFAGSYSISNDNLLLLTNSYQNGQQIDYKIVTMDLNTKQLWGSEIVGTRAVISGDAKFMVVTNQISGADAKIFKRGLTDWEQIGKVAHGEMFFSRLPSPRLISSFEGTTRIFNLDSSPNAEGFFTEAASAPIHTTGFDLVSNRITSETTDSKFISTISIYSVDDLQLVSTVKARVANNYIGPNHIILGERHIVISGFITDIE